MQLSGGASEKARSQPGNAPVGAWVMQEAGLAVLREVTASCGQSAIPIMPVKGIVTSRVLYADVAERPITDVDVRVRPRDLGRFRRLAHDAGWRCVRVARAYRNLTYDFGNLSLDVEATVGPPGLCALDVETMLGRAQRKELVPGLWVSVPEIHDHAVLLAVNAFKDKLVTAQPWAVTDLERVVLSPGFFRETFIRRAIESRIVTLAWIVAEWMESSRGSAAWGQIRAAIESHAPIRRAYARLFQRQLAHAGGAPMSLRLLARAGGDSAMMQIEALTFAAAWSAEMWLRGSGGPGRAD